MYTSEFKAKAELQRFLHITFLQRNLSQCQRSVKCACYNTYVRPTLEYASSVWSPHLLSDINRIEMVQRRSTRFVYNDFARTSSVTSMLNNLNWPLLQQRRDIAKVIMFYKIINNLISIPHDHITISPVSTRGHNLRYIQLAAKSNTYLFSFFPRRSNCGIHYQTLSSILLI